ncbi:catechol 2,3-dioxygenase [Novosphingobium lubricantis]|uniref:catechol 2,3-dioxygenase n=1 Tax=Novosphingobium sp. CCH12-A3 TaxID=1768752 RepID=UPI0007821BFB|nr:catechol 2,3-dioxygenase [Novosphingobium sp. CCH12-A3]
MAIHGVLRLGEICVRVLDIEAARRHYGEYLGLIETGRDDDGKTYYKAWDEHDCHSVVIRQADQCGVDYVAFKVLDDDTLSALDQRLQDYGVETRQIPSGTYARSGRRVEFTLPTGHVCQLYAFKEQVGNGMDAANPGTIPDDGYIKGMRIIRLDHCLLGGRDIAASRDLFIKVFGFNLTEELQDHESRAPLATFVSCSNKPHDIAFVAQPEDGKLHHMSFLLESVNDLYHAADRMGKYDIPIDFGPNRHGVTRGATVYFFDPSGNRNEVFTGGYVYYPDNPALIWDTSKFGNALFSQGNVVVPSFLNVLT